MRFSRTATMITMITMIKMIKEDWRIWESTFELFCFGLSFLHSYIKGIFSDHFFILIFKLG